MKRILIIEDDANIAEMERDYLQLSGYKANIASDGARGLEMALANGYDLIIIDLMLPNRSGFEIIKEIRTRSEVPLVVVSARADDIDKIRGFELGADDYLTKPFSPAELAARVKSRIARYERLMGGGAPAEIISRGGLEINTASHRVFVNGREAQLTPKEYAILLLLATHPNIVFTKERIFDRVWGDDPCGETATVAVHIQKIRKKIEKDPGNPEVIETTGDPGHVHEPLHGGHFETRRLAGSAHRQRHQPVLERHELGRLGDPGDRPSAGDLRCTPHGHADHSPRWSGNGDHTPGPLDPHRRKDDAHDEDDERPPGRDGREHELCRLPSLR